MIYLDYAATTPVDREVADTIQTVYSKSFGNASSIHSFGREAKRVLEESRREIASILGAEPGEIYFTGSGTESDNWAVKGLAEEGKKRGKHHIITSSAEHHAVLNSCTYLSGRGFDVTVLPVDGRGIVEPADVEKAIRPATALITIMHVNNEVGSINDIGAIGGIARSHGIPFHTDAVQSFGKIPVDVSVLPVTAFSFSAHKIYGPKGIGGLYIRKGSAVESMLHGGGQEKGRRAGTENVPLAAGFGCAARRMNAMREAETGRIGNLRRHLAAGLQEKVGGVRINTPLDASLESILNISFDAPVDGEVLLINLDLEGLAVSNGSACTSGSIEPSHVLRAMGKSEQHSKAALRFSIGRMTTVEEIGNAVEIVSRVIGKMKGIK